jgi:hypothetical protein
MQYVNLLGAFGNQVDLDSFVKAFFQAIEVVDYEERESGNYADGRYFRGGSGDIGFTISLSEEEDHDDLPCWIQVAADMPTSEVLVDVVDRMVREKALPEGFRIARMISLGKRDEQRIDY